MTSSYKQTRLRALNCFCFNHPQFPLLREVTRDGMSARSTSFLPFFTISSSEIELMNTFLTCHSQPKQKRGAFRRQIGMKLKKTRFYPFLQIFKNKSEISLDILPKSSIFFRATQIKTAELF